MSPVAIFTDSASDMDPAVAAAEGITIVPAAGDLRQPRASRPASTCRRPQFWDRMVAPDAPFPTTAASSPGEFKEAYEAAFAAGADAIVSVHVAGDAVGHDQERPDRPRTCCPIARSTSSIRAAPRWPRGSWRGSAVELAADGRAAEDIAATLEARGPDMRIYVALETLDYLRKGGRISGAQAAIGTLLSVKPIIRVRDGVVDTVDRVRTRSKARERLIELICERPIERLAILHTISPDVEAFRDEVLDRAPGGLDPADVTIDLVGASVGPHLGPGCVGAAILYRA